MNLPSRDYLRTAVRQPGKLPTQLDAVWHAVQGRWRRRRRVRDEALALARQVVAREAATADLSEPALRSRLHAHRVRLRRNRPGAWEAAEVETLADLREAARRGIGLLPHPEQIAAVALLRRGALTEMATGEGKSLVAALAAVTVAWEDRPCHVVTVNDYLAERDATWFTPFFKLCGVAAAPVLATHGPEERRAGHAADITYTTSKELLADFLRDRLLLGRKVSGPQRLLAQVRGTAPPAGPVLRGLHTVIVDEADSLLIDEAVTPLIISTAGTNDELREAVQRAAAVARSLTPGEHFRRDERHREVVLLPAGRAAIAAAAVDFGGIWRGPRRREELVRQALQAKEFFEPGRQYVITEDRVVIVDEFTGRLMPGRTWREGLHQAVEAKEGLPVSAPSEVIARMSFQRFFRLFPRLCGMSGTARENAAELWHVYALPVLTVPRHRPLRLRRLPLRCFASAPEKWNAVIDEIAACHRAGQPVLVGLRNVRTSEALAERLVAEGLPFHLLNATRHREEAFIVARAGERGQITLATNMAGRGTDIKLGPGVTELGGLHVIATEFHESGRIDRQLFGRGARQGDPGSCRMFASLDDELFTRFVPAVARGLVRALFPVPGLGPLLARAAFHRAQRAAEAQSRRARKAVLRGDEWIDESVAFGTPPNRLVLAAGDPPPGRS